MKRRELIIAFAEIQGLIGEAMGLLDNDRSDSARGEARRKLDRALGLCVEATADDRPATPIELARFQAAHFKVKG